MPAIACVAATALLLLFAQALLFIPLGTQTRRLYRLNESISIDVNSMTAPTLIFPVDYYANPLACRPPVIVNRIMTIGEALRGGSVRSSPYEGIRVGVNQGCTALCISESTSRMWDALDGLVRNRFRVNLMLGGHPVVQSDPKIAEVLLGDSQTRQLYNHVHLTIDYEEDVTANSRHETLVSIVGFSADPVSVHHDPDDLELTCNARQLLFDGRTVEPQPALTESPVVWSYQVVWRKTNVVQHSAANGPPACGSIAELGSHTIRLSLAVVALLALLVFLIYIPKNLSEITGWSWFTCFDASPRELEEINGWMLLHGDVFRVPRGHGWLTALCGVGSEVLASVLSVLLLLCFGLLSPASVPGALLTALLLAFALAGSSSGYVSARVLRMWGAPPSWCFSLPVAFFAVPTASVVTLFVVKEIAEGQGSTLGGSMLAEYLPRFGALLTAKFLLFAAWACVGLKQAVIEMPVETNLVPRKIPRPVWYAHPAFTVMLGSLAVGTIALWFSLLLSATVWERWPVCYFQLLLVFVLVVCTSGATPLVALHFQLRAADHRWMWRSFLTSGCSGFVVFVIAARDYTKLVMERAPATAVGYNLYLSTVAYFSIVGLMCLLFSIMTGTIGFVSSMWYMRRLYCRLGLDKKDLLATKALPPTCSAV